MIDATGKLSNASLSLRKFFVDELETGKGLSVAFDRSMINPDLQDSSISDWIVIGIGRRKLTGWRLSALFCEITACSRKDPEGDVLAELIDSVMDVTDAGRKPIDLYNDLGGPGEAVVGTLRIQDFEEGEDLTAPDGTKFRTITCRISWVAKV